ncbi:MAG TPA: hypothetical protein VG368_00385, partial [Acidimicrobiales bacterium]|nr:hypothetical protein [Acidimicrobiales bacterium]
MYRSERDVAPSPSIELDRLRRSPRGLRLTTDLLDPPVRIADGPSFVPQYESIFIAESYDFPFEGPAPTIVDGGANIGMGIIWWRAKWPEARVIAFEPDPEIFEILAWNTRFHHDLDLRQQALTAHGKGVTFLSEGTDAGRIDAGDNPIPDGT